MDTTTIVLIVVAVAVLVLASGSYLFIRRRNLRHATAEAFLHFRCPGCQRRLRFRARQAGHSGQCSHCGHDVIFPRAGQSID